MYVLSDSSGCMNDIVNSLICSQISSGQFKYYSNLEDNRELRFTLISHGEERNYIVRLCEGEGKQLMSSMLPQLTRLHVNAKSIVYKMQRRIYRGMLCLLLKQLLLNVIRIKLTCKTSVLILMVKMTCYEKRSKC